jgi:hypothetical protein
MREHIYRSYDNLGVAICVNCTEFKHKIEATAHYIFESGYCELPSCPRCQAEICVPLGGEPVKPEKGKYLSLDLEEWQ